MHCLFLHFEKNSLQIFKNMPESSKPISKAQQILLLIGILCIAVNLRPALASVGPLIGMIRESTGLSNTMLGLLTTLPLLAFGLVSSLIPMFTKRFGIGGTLLGALFLLTVGIFIRSIDGLFTLYLGTIMLGIAIAFGNVLLPSLTKRNFANSSGLVTSLYSSVMSIGASVAAGISIPLAIGLDWGWQGALLFWSLISGIAFLVWIPQVFRLKKSVSSRSYIQGMRHLGSKILAWKIALFMGLQSFTFYVILAWLPALLQNRGLDADYSGWMLSLSQATGILGAIIVPFWAGKRVDQRRIVMILISIEIIGLIGLLLAGTSMIGLWVSLVGFVLGGNFGLALLFIVLRSKDAETATELSGMAQSIGYLVAASGPLIFGLLYDFTGNWNIPLGLLIVVSVVKIYMGVGAGKAERI